MRCFSTWKRKGVLQVSVEADNMLLLKESKWKLSSCFLDNQLVCFVVVSQADRLALKGAALCSSLEHFSTAPVFPSCLTFFVSPSSNLLFLLLQHRVSSPVQQISARSTHTHSRPKQENESGPPPFLQKWLCDVINQQICCDYQTYWHKDELRRLHKFQTAFVTFGLIRQYLNILVELLFPHLLLGL